jgi:hypothetical protein
MSKKRNNQKKEIMWNIINSILAGALVLLGSCSSGDITKQGLFIAFVAASIVAVSRFKDYWSSEEKEYKSYTIAFI